MLGSRRNRHSVATYAAFEAAYDSLAAAGVIDGAQPGVFARLVHRWACEGRPYPPEDYIRSVLGLDPLPPHGHQ